jgi:hypothetical protein
LVTGHNYFATEIVSLSLQSTGEKMTRCIVRPSRVPLLAKLSIAPVPLAGDIIGQRTALGMGKRMEGDQTFPYFKAFKKECCEYG